MSNILFTCTMNSIVNVGSAIDFDGCVFLLFGFILFFITMISEEAHQIGLCGRFGLIFLLCCGSRYRNEIGKVKLGSI